MRCGLSSLLIVLAAGGSAGAAPAVPGAGLAPAHAAVVTQTKPAEDCVSVDPQTVLAVNSATGWKVMQGTTLLLDFGTDNDGAKRAIDVIQHYHFTKQCFVHRPNATMMYWKNGVAIPPGNITGQDCIQVNPADVQATFADGRWKVMDGKTWLLDYQLDRNAADQAVGVIRSYGLNRECFIARPHVAMQYWLEQ